MPHRFDPSHADRLRSPERRQMQYPFAILDAIGVSLRPRTPAWTSWLPF
jgi:hypothetical protein